MNSKKLAVALAIAMCGLSAVVLRGQSQVSRPDFAGKWTLVGSGPSGPLGIEGVITQDAQTIEFRSSSDRSTPVTIRLDGAAVRQDGGAYMWEYQARWVGRALVISMKATSGTTPGSFEDLMIVSPSGQDTLSMVLLRNTLAGTMKTYALTYRKS
jgi:hypothetical protein